MQGGVRHSSDVRRQVGGGGGSARHDVLLYGAQLRPVLHHAEHPFRKHVAAARRRAGYSGKRRRGAGACCYASETPSLGGRALTERGSADKRRVVRAARGKTYTWQSLRSVRRVNDGYLAKRLAGMSAVISAGMRGIILSRH